MGLAELFSGANFENTITKYCAACGWKLADLNNRRAILRFNMDSGRVKTLFIVRYDTTLEFSVQSMAAFDSEDNIPHFLSTLLLQWSTDYKMGFWCIENIGEKHVYSVMHNAEMQLINNTYFERVVRKLISECDKFEEILIRVFSSSN